MKTFASLFSGGGGADLGAKAAGYTPRWAVEYDAAIADVYRANLGDHIITADVCSLDYTALPRIDWLHASPVCTRYSVANNQRGESDLDMQTAAAVARAIDALSPDSFTLENVQQYEGSDAYRLICQALDRNGYMWHAATLNSADYGVPQTRRRLILRASKGLLRGLPPPVAWVGWYAAIADLIPTLPSSAFAPWQLERLPGDVRECLMVDGQNSRTAEKGGLTQLRVNDPSFTVTTERGPRAFILDCQESSGAAEVIRRAADEPCYTSTCSTGTRRPARAWLFSNLKHTISDKATARNDSEPSSTVDTTYRDSHTSRAWLSTGRVVAMTPRALARFQSFPDTYVLPDKKALACKIIGNAVPPLLMQTIGESL